MAENTKIEWCHSTFNPWRGCSKVSEGCKFCYAETLSGRNPGTLGVWGPNGTRVVAAESAWKEPLKWDRKAKEAGERHRVFCASLADVFEDWPGKMVMSNGDEMRKCAGCEWKGTLPVFKPEMSPGKSVDDCPLCGVATLLYTMQDARERLFRLIDATPNLDWLLLTKRPENIARMMPQYTRTTPSTNYFFGEEADRRGLERGKGYESTMSVSGVGVFRPNVWIGTSVENQKTADERIPHLLTTPAAVRFLSMEPLLGPVDLAPWLGGMPAHERHAPNCDGVCFEQPRIGWVIVGGESGHGSRPMHPDWARSIRDQCQAAGVAFHFKQWGEFAPNDAGGMYSVGDKTAHTIDELGRLDVRSGGGQLLTLRRVGKKNAGRLLDGREWSQFPEVSS